MVRPMYLVDVPAADVPRAQVNKISTRAVESCEYVELPSSIINAELIAA